MLVNFFPICPQLGLPSQAFIAFSVCFFTTQGKVNLLCKVLPEHLVCHDAFSHQIPTLGSEHVGSTLGCRVLKNFGSRIMYFNLLHVFTSWKIAFYIILVQFEDSLIDNQIYDTKNNECNVS